MFSAKILPDNSNQPVNHPEIKENFGNFKGETYELKQTLN